MEGINYSQIIQDILKSGEVLSTSRLGKHFASLFKYKKYIW